MKVVVVLGTSELKTWRRVDGWEEVRMRPKRREESPSLRGRALHETRILAG